MNAVFLVSRRVVLRAGMALVAAPLVGASEEGDEVEIKRVGSQPSGKGPADWFTGTVRIDPLFDAPDPARAAGASVTFEPGARTAWHTHPLGQTLIVTSGYGRVQHWGGLSRKFGRATSCGSRLVKSIGTARRRQPR